MKRFFLKTLFLIPLLLLFTFIEQKLGTIQNSYNFKRKCLEQQLDSIEVIALGSSQILYGVNPEYFRKKCFNLANNSQTLYYDSKLIIKYLDKMPKLKSVIISISYFSMGSQLIDGVESWREYYYSQFWNVTYPEVPLIDIRRYSKFFLYSPQTSIEFIKEDFKINLANGFNPNGFYSNDTLNNDLNISDSLGKERVEFHNQFYKTKRLLENQTGLINLVKILNSKNIKVIFITPPVFITYSKYISQKIRKENTIFIASVCKKYNAEYFDYFSDSSFIKKDFFDNDHLNFLGAKKLSLKLNNEIEKVIH